ncbi:Hypothetical predicted protein, partial [Paramuricea clavata]
HHPLQLNRPIVDGSEVYLSCPGRGFSGHSHEMRRLNSANNFYFNYSFTSTIKRTYAGLVQSAYGVCEYVFCDCRYLFHCNVFDQLDTLPNKSREWRSIAFKYSNVHVAAHSLRI